MTDNRRHPGYCHNWRPWRLYLLPNQYSGAPRSFWVRECRNCPKLQIRSTEPR
jgi:hypothetical protein